MRSLKVVKSGQELNSSRLHVFIHEKHNDLIEELMRRRRGVTKKDIVYSALENYFNPEPTNDQSGNVISELSKLKKEQHKLKFNMDTLLDTFAVFVKIWMCHTHEIPKEHEAAAVASMNRRFKKFTDLVLAEMKTGTNPLLAFDPFSSEETADKEEA